MKKFLKRFIVCCGLISMIGAAAVYAENLIDDSVVLKIAVPYAIANNMVTQIDTDNRAVVPVIIEDRTLVPVRFISEAFGAGVAWNEATKGVSITLGPKNISMTLGDSYYRISDMGGTASGHYMDVTAQSINDRTFVPLRVIAEALDKEVFWDERGLIIISGQELQNNITEENIKQIIDSLSENKLGTVVEINSTVNLEESKQPQPDSKTEQENKSGAIEGMELYESWSFEEKPYGLSYKDGMPMGLTDEMAHTGQYSVKADQDWWRNFRKYPVGMNGIVTMWMYDHADAGETVKIFARVDSGEDAQYRAIGIATEKSMENYCIRIDGETSVTDIKRTKGWHELKFDYTSGNGMSMYIDNVSVGSFPGVDEIRAIDLRDFWSSNDIANVYFDDIQVWQ